MTDHPVLIKGIMTMIDPTKPDAQPDTSRKTTQIVGGTETNPVYALCSDNSIWCLNKEDKTWYRIPDVPQSDAVETPHDKSNTE
jgi:hypothetical protein